MKSISKDEWIKLCNEHLTIKNIVNNTSLTANQCRYLSSKYNYKCPLDSHSKDERGNTYGDLVVINFAGRNNRGEILWNCVCKCGEEVVRVGTELRRERNQNQACPSCLSKKVGDRFLIDLTGKTFNHIYVIERIGSNSSGNAIYKCKCNNCGTLFTENSGRIPNRISCGCVKSKGEYVIAKLLTELKIPYKKQFIFKDCKDKGYLKFDFAVFDNNDKLQCLIEYQGLQHYEEWKKSKIADSLETRQRRDNIKRKYCKDNNIRLIEIPYYDFSKLNKEYIKNILF